MDEIINDIASRSDGSNEFGEGGKAVARFYRASRPEPDKLLHMLAVAVNEIAELKKVSADTAALPSLRQHSSS